MQNSCQLTISAAWSGMVDGKINFKTTTSFENTFWNRQIIFRSFKIVRLLISFQTIKNTFSVASGC